MTQPTRTSPPDTDNTTMRKGMLKNRLSNLYLKRGPLGRSFTVFGAILDKIIFTHVVVIGVPTLLYYFILNNDGNLLALHWVIPVLYFLTSVIVMGEAIATAMTYSSKRLSKRPRLGLVQRFLRVRRRDDAYFLPVGSETDPTPSCSLVVAAYLPNEQGIILETLNYILETIDRPAGGFELVLAYNTPIDLPIEQDLAALAERYPELKLLRVEGSRSKAENLNAAMKIVKGEITGILDADHRPNPDSFEIAWNWLSTGRYSVVQGRNVIRNYDTNFMTQMIAVEFECMYGASHPAKSLLFDTGIFCGSNGYWKTSVLKKVRFSPQMLTEDIDASLRTMLKGYQIVHDPRIIITELAPEDVPSFWSQRKRWAQGWMEVAIRHQVPLLGSKYLDRWQKAYWTMLLVFSAAFHFVALQVFPILLSLSMSGVEAPELDPAYFWVTTVLTLLSGPTQALAAWVVRYKGNPQPFWAYLGYCFFIPFYCVFKSMIAIIAIYDHISGNTEWVVTKRAMKEEVPLASSAGIPTP
jgi:cellulose synthase/poly-beta-1,6-N-acetylglucosamine synthase-like glycosyltransferase